MLILYGNYLSIKNEKTKYGFCINFIIKNHHNHGTGK